MFAPSSPHQPDNVLSHWYVLLDDFQFSSVEFYERVLVELKARNVPRLRTRRVAYHEGSLVSDKRLYLRLSRERFSFEVCAAPFGRCYFFSLRFVELPRGGWIQLLFTLGIMTVALALAYWLGLYAVFRAERWFWWVTMGVISSGLGISTLRHKLRIRADPEEPTPSFLSDLDSFMLGLPVIGAWYERIRKDTFYRQDTRLMYLTLISDVVKRAAKDAASGSGVRLVETYEFSPILKELYTKERIPLDPDKGSGD